MSLPVVAGVLNLARRRAQSGLKTFQLEFFGGEPMTAWDVVAPLAGGLAEICRAGGVRLFGGMTTNGVLLTRPRVDRLAAWGLHAFQVTLDGPQSVHDRRRRALRGAGSFDAVWRRCKRSGRRPSAQRGDQPALRSDDARSAFGETGFVREGGKLMVARGDTAFRLHFHASAAGAGPMTPTRRFSPPVEKRAAIADWSRRRRAGCSPRQLVQYRHDAALGESGHAICYAARPNAFVIRSDGRVAKCTVAFEDDRNTIGRLEANGDLVVDQPATCRGCGTAVRRPRRPELSGARLRVERRRAFDAIGVNARDRVHRASVLAIRNPTSLSLSLNMSLMRVAERM